MSIPKTIMAGLIQYPDSYATQYGLAVDHPNGTTEILVRYPDLDKQDFMQSEDEIEEEISVETSGKAKRGRKAKADVIVEPAVQVVTDTTEQIVSETVESIVK